MNRLEVGGNAFELIEFTLDRRLESDKVGQGRYGVNVAKVREVVRMPVINPLASSIPGIAGVFELRGVPIPAINLAAALGDKVAPIHPEQQIIVTEFSMKRAGFIVKATHRIRRIAWEKVLPPAADKHTFINGMTLIENNEFLFILDLEKLLVDIEIKSGHHVGDWPLAASAASPLAGPLLPGKVAAKPSPLPLAHPKASLLLVDDSDIILNNARNYLEKHGYLVQTATDGLQAQKCLQEQFESSQRSYDAVISDVEMPRMDGLSFTKWLKSHPDFMMIPVILHTSLSGNANFAAGKSVGADGYVVKNDMKTLLTMLEKFVA